MRVCFMLAVVVLLITRASVGAQSISSAIPDAPDRSIKLLREDEDWSFLANPDYRQDFWDPVKYIRLRSGSNDWFIAISGEARKVWEQIGNDYWGQAPYWNGHLNERYMLGFDIHYGKHVRTFVEFKSGINSFRNGGPRPIDEKKLVIAAFVAWSGRVQPAVQSIVYVVIALTGFAMGVRNGTIRRLGVPDLTTTVLTLTVAGLAFDSSIVGGANARWRIRVAAISMMFLGAVAGALVLCPSVLNLLGRSALLVASCAVLQPFREETSHEVELKGAT